LTPPDNSITDVIEEKEIPAETYIEMNKEMSRVQIESVKENTTNRSDEVATVSKLDPVLSQQIQEESSSAIIGRMKTLKNYIEGKPRKSPRDVDLELIKLHHQSKSTRRGPDQDCILV
jgi:hypothetical protein